MPAVSDQDRSAIRAEARQFVYGLGGYGLELSEAVLVTHERIPAPRLNFVEVRRVPADRRAAFVERALDHYFQRAIRPSFHLPTPSDPTLADALARYGFRRPDRPTIVLAADAATAALTPSLRSVRPAGPEELAVVASFWTVERERPELLAALDRAVHHPAHDERWVPLLGLERGRPVAAGLLHRFGPVAGLHAITTAPSARGQGWATSLVQAARAGAWAGPVERYTLATDVGRLVDHLEPVGFGPVETFEEFTLAPDATSFPITVGPPSGPHWRPPRSLPPAAGPQAPDRQPG